MKNDNRGKICVTIIAQKVGVEQWKYTIGRLLNSIKSVVNKL